MKKSIFNLSLIICLSLIGCTKTAEEYNKSGLNKAKKMDFEGAINDFSKAISVNPNWADSYYFRGMMHDATANYEGACDDFSKAIELGYTTIDVFRYRANAFEKIGEYNKAISDYSIIIKDNPKDFSAYFSRSKLKLKQKDSIGANEDMKIANSLLIKK